jgi:DDE superfamily endonuclease
MVTWQLPAEVTYWIAALAKLLDERNAFRLLPIFAGIFFGQGRRTVSSWLRAAGISDDYEDYYYFISTLGRKTKWLATRLLYLIRETIPLGIRVLLLLDDSPTKRYGPQVEGAGVHHNPTPGPAQQEFLYGHSWVVIGLALHHPLWGTICLPLLAKLYIRAKDILKLVPGRELAFKTKLELAANLVGWAASCLAIAGRALWVAVDGGYAKAPFLKKVIKHGVIVVSRLRKDAALYSVPKAPKPGEKSRGGPRKSGKERTSLAKRAAHRLGWTTAEFTLYGRKMTKTFKLFQATYRPVGGLIAVLLVKEDDGSWRAFFCSKADATAAEILEAVADRASIEQVFHDVKEVHGSGQQQVRNLFSNIAVYNLNLWTYTLIELWAWPQKHAELCDRSASPWDDEERRPSHANRRNALRRASMRGEFSALQVAQPITRKIRALFERVMALAA